MPMDRSLYPQNWEALALQIKQSVNWTCEGCGKPCRPPEIKLTDVEDWLKSNHPNWLFHLYQEVKHGDSTVRIKKPRRFSLTVAHLNHILERTVCGLRVEKFLPSGNGVVTCVACNQQTSYTKSGELDTWT